MRLVGPRIAMFEPLLDSTIVVPSVVSGEDLGAREAWVCEDLVLLLEDL